MVNLHSLFFTSVYSSREKEYNPFLPFSPRRDPLPASRTRKLFSPFLEIFNPVRAVRSVWLVRALCLSKTLSPGHPVTSSPLYQTPHATPHKAFFNPRLPSTSENPPLRSSMTNWPSSASFRCCLFGNGDGDDELSEDGRSKGYTRGRIARLEEHGAADPLPISPTTY